MDRETRKSLKNMYAKEDGVLSDYLDYCYCVRGLSKRTACNHYSSIRHFAKYIAHRRNRMECDVEEVELATVTKGKMLSVSEDEYEAYIRYVLYQKCESREYVRMRISYIRSFYRWLSETYQVDSPEFLLIGEKVKNTKPTVFNNVSKNNEQKLLDYFGDKQSEETAMRNICIVYLIINKMVSLSEIVSLDISDINMKSISIKKRNGETRVIELDEEGKAIVDNYLGVRSQPLCDGDPFFVTQRKRGRMRPCSVQKMLRVASTRALGGNTLTVTDLVISGMQRNIEKDGEEETFKRSGIRTRRYFNRHLARTRTSETE